MKVGDLIKWIDYRDDKPVECIGLLITDMRGYWSKVSDWNDIVVLTGKGHERWTSWQCVVIDESR